DLARLAKVVDHRLVVPHQLAQHLVRRDELRVVVLDALHVGDLPDRAQRGAADLAHAFGELVGGGEDLCRLLVEPQMIIAEMRAANVPMKVLGLQIEGKYVGEQTVERLRYLLDGFVLEIRRGIERAHGLAARFQLSDFRHGSPRLSREKNAPLVNSQLALMFRRAPPGTCAALAPNFDMAATTADAASYALPAAATVLRACGAADKMPSAGAGPASRAGVSRFTS